jgi:hypothetical protein
MSVFQHPTAHYKCATAAVLKAGYVTTVSVYDSEQVSRSITLDQWYSTGDRRTPGVREDILGGT